MPNPMKRPVVQQNQGYRSNNQIASEAATVNTNPNIGVGQAGIMDFPAKGQAASRTTNTTAQPPNLGALKSSVGDISSTLPKKIGYKANAVADLAMGDTSGAVTNLAKNYVPGVSMASRAVDFGKRLGSGDTTGALLEGAGAVVPVVPDLINAGRDIVRDVNQRSIENNQFNQRNREVRGSLKCRNTGIIDSDGSVFVNNEDVELLGKLGFEVEGYAGLEKTSEVLDLYSYIEKVAGVSKEVAKLIDRGEAFSGEYLKDMGYNIPKGYEVKGDLCCPIEKESSIQTIIVEKQSAERPGLWANIHAKRKRGEKAAKPGDEDYPDKKQWDKLSKEAMTLSATKDLLRKFRAAGGKVIREKGGGAYYPFRNSITLPTREEKARDVLATLWHEYGHSADVDAKKGLFTSNPLEMLLKENTANTNALNEIKRLGVPLSLQKKYIDDMSPGFNTYRSHAYTNGPKKYVKINKPMTAADEKKVIHMNNAISAMEEPRLREGLILKDPFNEVHRSAIKHLRKTNPAYDKAFRQYHGEFKELLSLPVAGPSPLAKQAALGAGEVIKLLPKQERISLIRAYRKLLERQDPANKKAIRAVMGTNKGSAAPKVVAINGEPSLLHYRADRSVSGLKHPRAKGDPSFEAHVKNNTGGALSTTVDKELALRLGVSPYSAKVLGTYTTPLKELATNQRNKNNGAMVNNIWPKEREITQASGENLLKAVPYEANTSPSGDVSMRPIGKIAASAAWQRSEGKNPEGGLNAKGRASYKKQTGGTLKAPVTESNPSGERAKRQNSFCSRMCGMKRKNTGSKGQSDPNSRINKSLRKWNCKCGEDHSSLFEKVACTLKEAKGRCWEGYEPVPGKEAYSEDSCRPKKDRKEVEKEAGFKSVKGKTLANKQDLLPGMSEELKKQPFNHTENAFARGRIGKALRDSILSGRKAEELRPSFEKLKEYIKNL